MKISRNGMAAAVIAFSVALTSCITTQNLTGMDFSKETVPNSRSYFSQVWAVEADNELTVSGKLRLKGVAGTNARYVEVALVSAAGKVLERRKVPFYPRMLTGLKGRREARFTAQFSEIPPRGTVIRLSNVN